MEGYYYEPYIVPFVIGVLFLFARIWTRFFSWISVLPKSDKKQIFRNAISIHTFKGLWEAFSEILLHLRTFYINKKLWYMHLSLAFGWFLMIAVSKVNTALYLKSPINPPYIEIFFSKYFPNYCNLLYSTVMDVLLCFVLSGYVMVAIKRRKPEAFGLKVSLQRSFMDNVASYSLWMIFPLRLISESLNSGIYGCGGFLTGTLGELASMVFPENTLISLNNFSWWIYSFVSAIFMISIPYSRYLHIFAEIPLIFLRNFGIKAHRIPTTFTFLESAACSRCGLCNEVCPLIKSGVTTVGAPMAMIKNVRAKKRVFEVLDTCLMCGECERICPVRIEHTTIRLGEKYTSRHNYSRFDLSYLEHLDKVQRDSKPKSKVGYFAGCSTHHDLYILKSMTKILNYFEGNFVFVDDEYRICCGASLRNSGNINDAERLADKLDDFILQSGITKLVVNCPTCYKNLSIRKKLTSRVEVVFYTDYIVERVGSLSLKGDVKYSLYTPCPVRDGSLDISSTHTLINKLGTYVEPNEKNICCGSANFATSLSYEERVKVSNFEITRFDSGNIDEIVTICPSCKKALKNNGVKIRDISEIIANTLQKTH
ncbi:MAG: (Fe-S)-binding protein [Rikenellaceae bacterium]